MNRISAKDIEQWAQRRDSEGDLPWLIRRLIRYSCQVEECDIPDGEQITSGGYDGEVVVGDEGYEDLVPPRRSVWEMSTERSINGKARDDYDLRTNGTVEKRKAKTAFVFATPRYWQKRTEWLQEKQQQRVWRDVKGLNSRSIQKWMEDAPAIASMFCSHCLHRDPWGLETIEMIWEDCAKNIDISLITKAELTPEFVIAGRQEKAQEIGRWLLYAKPGESGRTLRIFGPSIIEIVHFISAVIRTLLEDEQEDLFSTVFWIKTEAGAHEIATLSQNSTILASKDLATRALALQRTQRCRAILMATGEPEVQSTQDVVICAATTEQRIREFVSMGCSSKTAIRLCEATSGDYLRIRREAFFVN